MRASQTARAAAAAIMRGGAWTVLAALIVAAPTFG